MPIVTRKAGRLLVLMTVCAAILDVRSGAAQREAMRVFVSVDMEGVAGVTNDRQVSSSGQDYELGRRLMIAEANAAIRGAFGAGATEVVVRDSHGSMLNLLPDELDPRAVLISGSPTPLIMMEGLDSTFAAVVCIGYHARSSTVDAVMAHTYSGSILRIAVNNEELGEFGINARFAASHGVPVVFASGDGALVREAKAIVPELEVVTVKEGIGERAARMLLSPERARAAIEAGVRAALSRRRPIRPSGVPSGPTVLEIEFATPAQADLAAWMPGAARPAARTIRYTARDFREAYRALRVALTLAL